MNHDHIEVVSFNEKLLKEQQETRNNMEMMAGDLMKMRADADALKKNIEDLYDEIEKLKKINTRFNSFDRINYLNKIKEQKLIIKEIFNRNNLDFNKFGQ